ncbi:hypothetical protein [Mesorhizobium sp. DCY119]|uniref:hypothetical protein n=1 Tax=Mesorhizobium sp. DCY119 TaxID=2108445 RepID=UPI000E6B4FB0|nr:hypothetical protein [Mesorhizobium sp. DCY119]RJG46463.1 hypothetical protein D3Y55_20935 [Mesorhizobium sp. DCY119]
MRADAVLQACSNVISIAIGIFLGLALADISAGERDLWEWQTLIAGILAVAAAGITVFQMQRIDARQHERHGEVMALNLRADRLRIQRATVPAASDFRKWSQEMTARLKLYQDEKSDPDVFKPSFETMGNLSDKAGQINTLLLGKGLKAAEDLYGPELTQRLAEARSGWVNLNEQLNAAKSYLNVSGISSSDAEHAMDGCVLSIRPLIPLADIIAGALEALATEYRRTVGNPFAD